MFDTNNFSDRNLAENEEVIAKVIKYLKYKDPANANREYAVGLLKRMQHVAKNIADKSPVSFEEFIDRYNQSLENS